MAIIGFNKKNTSEFLDFPSIFSGRGQEAIRFKALANMESFYSRIFFTTLERTEGLDNIPFHIFTDNSNYQHNQKYGLIHYIVEAYTTASHVILEKVEAGGKIFLREVVDKGFFDTKTRKEVEAGTYIQLNYEHYKEPILMLALFCRKEYLWESFDRAADISLTPQLKIANLRSNMTNDSKSRAALDSNVKQLAEAFISNDKLAVIDAADTVEMMGIGTDAIEASLDYIYSDVAFNTWLPLSFISGDRAASLGDSGDADGKQLTFALKQYANKILYPAINALFPETEGKLRLLEHDESKETEEEEEEIEVEEENPENNELEEENNG